MHLIVVSERQVPLSRELKLGLAVLLLAGLCAFVIRILPDGPGARGSPSGTEVALARRLRMWSLPASPRAGPGHRA